MKLLQQQSNRQERKHNFLAYTNKKYYERQNVDFALLL